MSASTGRIGKSEELKAILRAKLKSGQYKPGEQLPSEAQLVAQFGYSKGIVREAIGLLVNEGYVNRIQGKGTFVSVDKPNHITIAVVVPELDTSQPSIPAPLVSAIVAEARKHGARILLFVNEWLPELERQSLLELKDRRVDGAIVLMDDLDSNLDVLTQIRNAGIPLVLADRYADGMDFSHVATDNFMGAYDAVNAIAEMGVSSVYYLSTTTALSSVRDRMLGYTQAVNDLGLPCNVTLVNASEDTGILRGTSEYNCIKRSLENAEPPLAVFMLSAFLNPVVCAVLEDLRIPPDQCIFAHFDTPLSEVGHDMCYLQVDQREDEIGVRCVQAIMDQIKGNTEPQKIAVKPNLVMGNRSAFIGRRGDSEKRRTE